MQIRVTPVYGYGWSSQTGFAETPRAFEMDVEVVKSGEPFAVALGLVKKADHPLDQLWVLLDQRTVGLDSSYTLHAFHTRPDLQAHSRELPADVAVAGFASIERI